MYLQEAGGRFPVRPACRRGQEVARAAPVAGCEADRARRPMRS